MVIPQSQTRPQSLRCLAGYTFITNAIKLGELPATVQRLARHSAINLTFRVYADLGLEDLYHGASRGAAITPATAAKGGSRKRSKRVPTAAKNETANPAEQETGAKSVALNVALPGVPERLAVTPDVTTRVGGGEPVRSTKPRKRSPKTQGATGDSSPCRPVSQNVETERVGFEPTRNLRPCRFSRPVQSATLPPLRVRLLRRGILLVEPIRCQFRRDADLPDASESISVWTGGSETDSGRADEKCDCVVDTPGASFRPCRTAPS